MKARFGLGLVVCVSWLVGLSGDGEARQDAKAKEPDKIFLGYVYRIPKKIDFSLYTHLAHAFITADAEGKINANKNCPNKQLVADAHKAGVKIVISLGGWGWDEKFTAMVKKTEAEARYAKAVLKIVDDFDYDGIDFDWEYPDNAEKVAGFERLSRLFRKELDAMSTKKGRHLTLTFAASADPGTLKWLSNKLLLDTMDWLNVMTYDYTEDERSTYAGHHSPLYASSKVPPKENRESTELTMKHLLERSLPANRLAVGLPLYGRGFAAAEPYAATKKGAKAPKGLDEPGYRAIAKLLKEKGWKRVWDDETKNPWAISSDRTAVIGYDDAESLSIRTDWAMKQGFRGVFFWEIVQDQQSDGTFPLQAATRKKWEESGAGAKAGAK